MKLTTSEQIAILITAVVLAFFAGYYVRTVTLHGTITIETETAALSEEEFLAEASQIDSDDMVETISTVEDGLISENSSDVETTSKYSLEPEEQYVLESNEMESNTEQATDDERIDLNSATLEELETLPGIGPALGQRIIDYREQNGDFQSTSEIVNVSGIGEKTFVKIMDLIKVGDS